MVRGPDVCFYDWCCRGETRGSVLGETAGGPVSVATLPPSKRVACSLSRKREASKGENFILLQSA